MRALEQERRELICAAEKQRKFKVNRERTKYRESLSKKKQDQLIAAEYAQAEIVREKQQILNKFFNRIYKRINVAKNSARARKATQSTLAYSNIVKSNKDSTNDAHTRVNHKINGLTIGEQVYGLTSKVMNGYSDREITSNPIFRIYDALKNANLLHTSYAQEVIKKISNGQS